MISFSTLKKHQISTLPTLVIIISAMPIFLRLCLVSIVLSVLSPVAGQEFSRREQLQLNKLLEESEVFNRGFTGFCLFNPTSRQFLINRQGDKRYTPASNTKIMTAFTGLTILNGEMPAIHYQSKGDTLQLWGTGYPFLLHPDFIAADTLREWLKARPESVWIINNGHYKDARFGEGWSWDDYPYGYQQEKAALPVYGNSVWVRKNGHLGPIQLMPSTFEELLIFVDGPTVGRLEDRNIFTFGPRAVAAEELDRRLPFRYELPLVAELLADTFKRTVHYSQDTLPPNYQQLSVPVADTLFQSLLKDSDNFIAEQMLLLCSAKRYGYLSAEQMLSYVNDTLLAQLPQPHDWVDGSGLSRYNQMAPQSITLVLDQLLSQYGIERMQYLFPAGGVSGTIERWYAGPDGKPFVFAKTGTLRHVHCLSGYIRCKSGQWYIFSFMHNNFPDKLSTLKKEMTLIFDWMYDHL